MEYGTEIEKICRELEQLTGIRLAVSGSSLSEQETLQKLTEILHRYRGRDNRNFFIQQFLLGQLSEGEIVDFARRFHLDKSTCRVLFLVGFRQQVESSDITVLGGLFDPSIADLVEMDDHSLALILQNEEIHDEESFYETAEAIRGSLATEVMKDVSVFYDSFLTSTEELPRAYRHLVLTRKIAETFYTTDRVFSYHKLGLKKLLYEIPREACAAYLADTLPNVDFKTLDDEMHQTILGFFENGLSIAETSRNLYLHRNTLVYRLDKFEKMSGLDIREFDDAILCRIGMMISEML